MSTSALCADVQARVDVRPAQDRMPLVVLSLLLSTTLGATDSLTQRDSSWKSQFPLVVAVDTPHVRPRAVEISDWYERRLMIHRRLSYAIIPVFGAQWFAGERLYKHDNQAPDWAKTTHRAGATTLAGLFTFNTVTGLWNLWDPRHMSQGSTLRTIHALTMLTGEAGFTYAGVKLPKEAEADFDKRREHRTIALPSTALTVASALMMKFFNK